MGLFSKFKLPTEEHGLSEKDRKLKSMQSMVLALLEVIQGKSYGPSSQESKKLQSAVEETSRLVLTEHTTPRMLAEARENVVRYARLSSDCQQQLMDDMGREMANATNELVENITEAVNNQMAINGQITESLAKIEAHIQASSDDDLKKNFKELKTLIATQGQGCKRVAAEFERANKYANRRAQMQGTAAHTDSLTGLANQKALENNFDLLSRQSRTGGVSVRIALIDLDLAHQLPKTATESDVKAVLKTVAKKIAVMTPAILYLGKLDQDAFLLIGGTEEVEWKEIVAQIERSIHKMPLEVGSDFPVHLRPYSSIVDQDGRESFADCLQRAQQICYDAKKESQNDPKKQIPA